VRKIEEQMRQPIEVLHDPAATVPSCEVSPAGARIFLPDLNSFDQYLFLHELLHIERYILEFVPQIVALGGGDGGRFE
jgi:hypothetical protein